MKKIKSMSLLMIITIFIITTACSIFTPDRVKYIPYRDFENALDEFYDVEDDEIIEYEDEDHEFLIYDGGNTIVFYTDYDDGDDAHDNFDETYSLYEEWHNAHRGLGDTNDIHRSFFDEDTEMGYVFFLEHEQEQMQSIVEYFLGDIEVEYLLEDDFDGIEKMLVTVCYCDSMVLVVFSVNENVDDAIVFINEELGFVVG